MDQLVGDGQWKNLSYHLDKDAIYNIYIVYFWNFPVNIIEWSLSQVTKTAKSKTVTEWIWSQLMKWGLGGLATVLSSKGQENYLSVRALSFEADFIYFFF